MAALADDIAYDSHDLDDGLRAGLFTMEDDRPHLPVVARVAGGGAGSGPRLAAPRLRHETHPARDRPRWSATVVERTRLRIARLDPRVAEAIRRARAPVVGFSPAMAEANRAIKDFLFARMYRHWRGQPHVREVEPAHRRAVRRLLHDDPSLLPDDWGEPGRAGPHAAARRKPCGDYIAGMTDRYAHDEYRRLDRSAAFRADDRP